MKLDQSLTPVSTALEQLSQNRMVPFDVPGHKRGYGNKPLRRLLGEKCLSMDFNSMKPIDNLCHPSGVIKEGEALAADAFGAAHAFFMVGGTTSAVQSMVFSTCKKGDKIILPRNVHRSVLNAIVLCGAVPVYIEAPVHEKLGIALGSPVQAVRSALQENPDAKAILVNNPTYYGICSDLQTITNEAHGFGIKVLVDEAHGAHFNFGKDLPLSAMEAGADMAAVSMHKSGGSLTQSSFLLCGEKINADYVRQIINLTQTTSASYLLLSSLDISRRNLATDGESIFQNVVQLSGYAREEINRIGGYYAYGAELINADSVFDFDSTKLSIHTAGIGLAGIEVYDLLRDEYDIQIEFGDFGNILAYISVGDGYKNVEMLIGALAEIKRRFSKEPLQQMRHEYFSPVVCVSPQEAFYGNRKPVPLRDCGGKVSAEFIMCYPPGIPIVAPGERITAEIVDYIQYAQEKGSLLIGAEDMELRQINILTGGG